MDTFEISKTFRFEAAHSLPHLPEGHKCRRLHGHSYRFEVVCRGPLDERGFVIDYAEISAAVDPIVDGLDHTYLAGPGDELADMLEDSHHVVRQFSTPTTAEFLARWLYNRIGEDLPSLHRIDFYETAKTRVSYPA